jgi:hypothetical protein
MDERFSRLATERTERKGRAMAVHSFTLILDLDYATDEQMDAIAAAGDDLMLGSSDGVAFVAVDRAADTLDNALRSAITDVEHALPGINVVRAEVDRADLDAPTAA